MNITLPHNVLLKAIKKAGVAAGLPEALDEEITKKNPALACIRITATKALILFESSVMRLSVKHSIPVSDTVLVDQEGSFCLQYSWLMDNLKTTSKSNTVVKITAAQNKEYRPSSGAIPNGNCNLSLVSAGSEIFSWENITYSSHLFNEGKEVDYDSVNPIMDILADDFVRTVDSVSWSTNPVEEKDILTRVQVVPVAGDEVYFVATDGKRCALNKIKASACYSTRSNGYLVEPKLVSEAAIALTGPSKMSLCSKNESFMVIDCGDSKVRMAIAPKDVSGKFNSIIALLESTKTPALIVMDRVKFDQAVVNVSKTNRSSFLLSGETGSDSVVLEATDLETGKKAKAMVACEAVETWFSNPSIAIQVDSTLEMTKRITGDNIMLAISEAGDRIKICDAVIPTLTCMMITAREKK